MNKLNHLLHVLLLITPATGCAVLAFVIVLAATGIAPANADDSATSTYVRNALFNPSRTQLNAETRGRVTIYDGLHNSEVETALNTQFGRIDNMMFVRTRHTLEDGSVEQDDDCD